MALSSKAPFPIKPPNPIHAMALGEVCLRGCVLVVPFSYLQSILLSRTFAGNADLVKVFKSEVSG
jgi:hypothetical protein